MQALHPTHFSASMSTKLSSRLYEAPVGQASTQAGSSHCMQRTGQKIRRAAGKTPTSSSSTLFQKIPGGVPFLILHTTTQVLHPIHNFKSITMPQCIFLSFYSM